MIRDADRYILGKFFLYKSMYWIDPLDRANSDPRDMICITLVDILYRFVTI